MRSMMSVRLRTMCTVLGCVLMLSSAQAADDAPPAPKLPPKIDPAGLSALLSAHKGEPVLINIFASWCVPCKSEIPDLERLHQAHPRFFMLGIDVDQDAKMATKFLA